MGKWVDGRFVEGGPKPDIEMFYVRHIHDDDDPEGFSMGQHVTGAMELIYHLREMATDWPKSRIVALRGFGVFDGRK